MTAYIGHLEKQTLANTFFRQVLFTGKHMQIVVMCLNPGEDIGDEVHQDVDQLFRIEAGDANFVFDEGKVHPAKAGDVVAVPAGTYHNVINPSKTAQLKLSTVYGPPNHPQGTVHKTKAEAMAAETVQHH